MTTKQIYEMVYCCVLPAQSRDNSESEWYLCVWSAVLAQDC